jgi:transmembrane sensor
MALVTDISPEIRAEAAAWLARLRADDKCSDDEAAFRAWLAKDARHAAAFERVTEIWEAAGAAWDEPITPPRRTHRRAVLAGVGSLAAAGVLVAVWQQAAAGTYETGIGEQKHAVLPDGTQVFLDADTKIRTHFDSTTRSVALERGRCNFHLKENDKRPFVVDAAADQVTAQHCTFDIRRDGNEVCVVLTQGAAEISAKGAGQNYTLRAGDRFVAGEHGSRTDRPNLAPLLAWQTGQVVFDNEAISDAIREMNRYSVVKLAVTDATVARLRISGVYRVGDNVAFAHSIASLLPVILEVEKDQVRLEPYPAPANRT